MGIHGSSTASLIFGEKGGCRGILLGEPHSGMAKMFEMMNEARMGCGVQSLGLAAAAYDTARQYAKERVQGPLFTNRRGDRVTIIQHEDVRRMLMNLKSGTEAMRALIGKLFYLIDVAEYDPDETTRKKAFSQVELLTPLVKAYISDFGYMLIRDAIQVLGGVGYCQEFPVEQYARDCKDRFHLGGDQLYPGPGSFRPQADPERRPGLSGLDPGDYGLCQPAQRRSGFWEGL